MSANDIKYFKIHPAIGVTRIANNDDYFEFYEAFQNNYSPASDYMSAGGNNDPQPGKMRLKRQAVRFSLYAYDENDQPLGKVEDVLPDARVSWTANVGNRKLYNYSEKKGGETINTITAEGTADSPDTQVELDGVNPFDSSKSVNLGSIDGTGLYIPPKGGVVRKNNNSVIDPYPADANGTLECSDTTCDGAISATVSSNGEQLDLTVIPAWVVATPSQHALTLTPVVAQNMADNFGSFDPSNNNQNKNWVKATKAMLNITGELDDPTGLDEVMMATMNADYNPGMEVNIGSQGNRIESGVVPKDFFYPRGQNHIGKNEIRVEEKDGSIGALPGQLTSGLCSTWQGDMVACLNYWTAENPNQAYGENGQVEKVIYQENDPGRTMNTPEEINTDMDFRGIVDYEKESNDNIKLNIVYDPNRQST